MTIDRKTMQSLVEAANNIADTNGINKASQAKEGDKRIVENTFAAKEAATVGALREDLKKRVASYFKSVGTDVKVTMTDTQTDINTIIISFKAHDGMDQGKDQTIHINYKGGKSSMSLRSSGFSGTLPIDDGNTASKAIRAHAEHFIKLSNAVKSVEALLTGFYDMDDIFPSKNRKLS